MNQLEFNDMPQLTRKQADKMRKDFRRQQEYRDKQNIRNADQYNKVAAIMEAKARRA